MAGLEIKNLTRHPPAGGRRVFSKAATDVLPDWDISLVFIGPAKARALNKKLRGKTYTPNVLSYALGKKSGEIFICPSETARQASNFNLEPSNFNLFLFIHGLLHIKGWAHGARMKRCEQTLLIRYGSAHSNRHRYRHVPDKNGRGGRNHG